MSEIHDRLAVQHIMAATLAMRNGLRDENHIIGRFCVQLWRNNELIWSEDFANTVMKEGKNVMLDAALAGSSYSVTGPFMGLISSVSYTTGPSATGDDTMASHSGWTEAGATNAPTYTAPRKTCVWNAASAGSKALSAGLTFTFTGGGTVKGAFICFGTGAVSTIDNTSGSLWGAGTFTADRIVLATDTLTVSYSTSL